MACIKIIIGKKFENKIIGKNNYEYKSIKAYNYIHCTTIICLTLRRLAIIVLWQEISINSYLPKEAAESVLEKSLLNAVHTSRI